MLWTPEAVLQSVKRQTKLFHTCSWVGREAFGGQEEEGNFCAPLYHVQVLPVNKNVGAGHYGFSRFILFTRFLFECMCTYAAGRASQKMVSDSSEQVVADTIKPRAREMVLVVKNTSCSPREMGWIRINLVLAFLVNMCNFWNIQNWNV